MAIGLQNYPNIQDDGSMEYPDGRLKDNPGDGSGTPINLETNGDIHQFLAKILREAGITPNGVPDNEYDGLQYFEALLALSGGTKTKIVDIGDWDMDATAIKNVAHGISDFKKIRSVFVMIRNDADGAYVPLDTSESAGDNAGWIGPILGTDIPLNRLTGGQFDSTGFDSTSYNRGFVTIQYIH